MAKTSGGLRGGANAAANRWAAGISNPDMRAEAETAAMLIASKLGISPASLPKIIEAQIKSGKGGATVANYRSNDFGETITINTDKKAVSVYKANKYASVKDGWSSQPNTVLHELSHGIHQRLVSELIRTPQGYRKAQQTGRLDAAIIKKGVSKYASTNSDEFHAELISGILSGKHYSKQILDDSILAASSNRIAKRLYKMGLKR